MDRTEEVRAALQAIYEGSSGHELESSTLDFKEDAKSEGDTVRTLLEGALCFANSSGGVLVVGISDKLQGPQAFKGSLLNPQFVKKRVYELSRPHLIVDSWAETHYGVNLLFLSVPQSPEIHADTQGRAPRRVGTDCLPMEPGEQMRLREERLGIDWSAQDGEQSTASIAKEALDAARALLGNFVDERRRLSRLGDLDLLRALGVLAPSGRLLRAGEILFCPPARSGTPAVVYQYRATPGGEPRAVERLDVPLLLAFQRALELTRARIDVTPVTLPDGQQISIADFPLLAVREALANAVIHRDYHLVGPVVIEHSPEALAVTSPGPLVAGVTPENILTHPSKPRNPVLAKATRQLGLAEEVGRGVDRMFREMILSGREIPRIESTFEQVRILFLGGAANTQIARFLAQLPTEERDDTDTMLVLFRLCSVRTVTASDLAPLLQKSSPEAEQALRRLAQDAVAILEPTRATARRRHPSYRLRGEVLKALGSAVPYQRRTVDEIDLKVVTHVREYGKVTNRTVQNLFDVGIQRAKSILADLVQRGVLVKTSAHERGPGVEYGPGSRFPTNKRTRRRT